MDRKEIGKFIRELRKEKNLSQYELADIIHISRESISKWERGIGKPDKNCIQQLSKIFGVSTDELILGRKIENKFESETLSLNLYDKMNKQKKIILITQLIIVIISLLFFMYYFITNYNSIHAYTISYSDKNYTIDNGIFIITKEKIYFNLGNIKSNSEIKYLKLYYKDNKKENLIYRTDDVNIVLYDYYGYNNFFDYNKMNTILENLYLDIELENGIQTIKLSVDKYFSNDKIKYDKENEVIKTPNIDKNKINLNSIKEKFKEEDGVYTYINDNLEIIYFEDLKIINIHIKNKENIEEWNYYITQDMLSYTEYIKDNIKNSFDFSDNNYKCLIDTCSNEKAKVDYFYDLLYKILV
jgi:transcriptional regulator with XRE-family HTH domain